MLLMVMMMIVMMMMMMMMIRSFLKILHTYQKEQKGIKEVLEQVGASALLSYPPLHTHLSTPPHTCYIYIYLYLLHEQQVSQLFADHSDLLMEFTYFLPDAVQEQVLCTYCVRTVYVLYMYCVRTVYVLCTYCVRTVYVLCTYCLMITHFIYDDDTMASLFSSMLHFVICDVIC